MNLHILVGTVGSVNVYDNVVKISVATSYYDFSAKKRGTEWSNCIVFGKLCDFARNLEKGDKVEVVGETRTNEYDGKKMVQTIVSKIEILSKANRGEQSASKPKKETLDSAIDNISDDEIPF